MTNLFRRGGDRGTGRGASDGRNAVVCPSCGLRNDPSARFCRNCGLPLGWPQDPVRGTTTRHADLPSEHGAGVAAIIGLLVAVGVLVVAGFLVLRSSAGGESPAPSHSPSPLPSVALDSPSPSASGLLPSIGPSAGASPTPGVTEEPSPSVTEPPSTLPTTSGFTCDPASIADPTQGRWKVTHVTWTSSSGFDTVILDITRAGTSSRASTLSVETLTPGQVAARYGMTAPRNADQAVVVTFDRGVTGFAQSPIATGMNVVHNLEMDQGSDNLWHVALGAVGNGCYRIGVAAWGNNQTATDAQLLIDVKK